MRSEFHLPQSVNVNLERGIVLALLVQVIRQGLDLVPQLSPDLLLELLEL